MPGGFATGVVPVPVAVAVPVVVVVGGVVAGVVTGVTPGVVTVPVLVVVTGVGTGVPLTGVVLTGAGTGVVLTGSGDECEWCEPPPSCRGWPSWRSAPNKSCKNAWRSCGKLLGAAPEDAPDVLLVPPVAGVVVPGIVVLPVVVVAAGVDVVPVVPGAAVAVPAGWLVTNCVNAESNAVNRVPPPPCTPPPEFASPSLSACLAKLRVALNTDDRFAVGLVPDTAFVVIMLSLFELSRMMGIGVRRKTFSGICDSTHAYPEPGTTRQRCGALRCRRNGFR